MLTPEFLLKIAEAAEQKTAELNNYLTGRMAKRIVNMFSHNGKVEIIPSSILDTYKMKESGRLLEEVNQSVQQELPKIKNEVNKAFCEAAEKINVENTEFIKHVVEFESENGNMENIELPKISDYEKSGIPKNITELNLTQKEVRLLERAYKKTNGTLMNLTGTTAEACQKEFINAVDKAYWKATHGVNISTAIAEAVEECSKTGAVVTYPSGHTDRIETAVARAVRTGVAQAAGDISLARCAEMGVNSVIVSSHLGARYTDKDEPANHMSWQGKVYSLNWNDPVLKKYEPTEEEKKENSKIVKFLNKVRLYLTRYKEKTDGDFIEITGYGTGGGLCGWNCRHHFGPYYKGISINNNPNYDSEENRKRADLEKKQRGMEREITGLQRRKEALRYAHDECSDEETKNVLNTKLENNTKKLNEKRKQYNNFCADNGLKRRSCRIKAPVSNMNLDDSIGKKMSCYTGSNPIFDKKAPAEKCNIAKELTGKYVSRKSKWKGSVTVDDKKCNSEKITGRKEWKCSILVSSKAQPKTYIHEMLHSRSGSYLSPLTLPKYKKIEEASTEYLARQICIEEKISFTYADRKGVNALTEINNIVRIEENDFLFAKKLYNKDVEIRFTWVENKVKKYLNSHPEKKETLESCLKELRGM